MTKALAIAPTSTAIRSAATTTRRRCAVLDEALLCTVSWVDEEGGPRALSTDPGADRRHAVSARTARRPGMEGGRRRAEVCVVATVVDELVLARTSPAHSMNYRSVVLFEVGER